MANKNFEVKHGLSVGGTERITSAGAGSFTDLTLSGDLNITGDVNSVSVTDLDVTDKTITLGKGQAESASGGSGIVIDGSSASILWDESTDVFDFNKGFTTTGYVGIGSSNPDKALVVQGTGTEIVISDSDNTPLLRFRESGTTKGTISTATGAMIFQINGTTELMRLRSDSKVGIGATTSPYGKLTVTQTSGADNDEGGIGIVDSSNGRSLRLYCSATTSFINSGNGGAANLVLNEGTGKVGIGTSAPNQVLDVQGNIRIPPGQFLRAEDDDGTFRGAIKIAAPGTYNYEHYMASDGSNPAFFILNSTRHVGIGTSSPDRQLELEGQGVIRLNADGTTGQIDPGIDFNTEGTNDMQFRYRAASDKLAVYSYGTSSDVLTIQKADGNVGIGTTSPGTALQIGDGTGDEYITIDKSTTGTSGILLKNAGNNKVKLLANASEEFELHTNNALAMYVKESGDVLVGSSTNLDVLSGTPKIQVGSGSGHSSMQFYSGTGSVGALYFGDGTSGTDRYPGYIEYRHNNNTMAFRVNGTDHVVFLSNGQISCKNITATDGSGNVSVGYGALNVVQANSGDSNTALGYEAIEDVTSGNHNTGLGYRAGMNITTGNYNTIIGSNTSSAQTSASYNTILGYGAGGASVTGGNNVIIGYDAGSDITSGTNNVMIGNFDGNGGGFDIRTKSNNVVLSDGSGRPALHNYVHEDNPYGHIDVTRNGTSENYITAGAGATVQLFTGGNAFSGIFIINDFTRTGDVYVIMTGGGAISIISQTGSNLVTSSSPSSLQYGIYLSSLGVMFKNGTSTAFNFRLIALRTRNAQ